MVVSLSLVGKHCAIVGATGAIGLEIAKAFAIEGAVLTLLSRRAEQHRPSLCAALKAYESPHNVALDGPREHRFIKLDVREPGAIRSVFSDRRVPGEHRSDLKPPEASVGPVDILINCAGISQTSALKRTSDADIGGVIDTNLTATVLACKYAQVRPAGCIINVASLMGLKGGAGATAYAASKAGVIGFTRALCREMAFHSIRVNALVPGWVNSPMWDDLRPVVRDRYLEEIPLGRPGSAEEVAGAAVFLATNGYANNCVLNLDGGLSAV